MKLQMVARFTQAAGCVLAAVLVAGMITTCHTASAALPLSDPVTVWTPPSFPWNLGSIAAGSGGVRGVAFAEYPDGYVSRSSDHGATWSAPTQVFAVPFGGLDLEIGPGGTWIAAHSHGQIARSTDEGVTWSDAVTLLDGVSFNNNAGIGTDGHGTWVTALSVTDAETRRVFCFRSTDDGATWGDATEIFPSQYNVGLQALAMDEAGTVVVLGASQDDTLAVVRRSTDAGATWGPAAILFAGDYSSYSLGRPWYLATDGNGTWAALGTGWDDPLLVSRNNGYTWHRQPEPGDVYSGSLAADGNGNWLRTQWAALQRSTDDATTWLTTHQEAALYMVDAVMDDSGNWTILRSDGTVRRTLPEMDTDGDGLPDLAETNTGVYISAWSTGTDPAVADTDGDSENDGDEVAAGTYPLGTVWPVVEPEPVPPVRMSQAERPLGQAEGVGRPSIAKDDDGSWGVAWSGPGGVIQCAVSEDNGTTWTAPVGVATGQKPSLAADGESTWLLCYQGTDNGVRVMRSTNTGTWKSAGVIAPPSGMALDAGELVYAGGGQWLFVYEQASAIWYTYSGNAGTTWAESGVLVASDQGGSRPSVSSDGDGRCVVQWSQGGSADPDVLSVYSADGGRTWSDPMVAFEGGWSLRDGVVAVGQSRWLAGAYIDECFSLNTFDGQVWQTPWGLNDLVLTWSFAADTGGNVLLANYLEGGFVMWRSFDDGLNWTVETTLGRYGNLVPAITTPSGFPGSGTVLEMDDSGHWLFVWITNGEIYAIHSDTETDSDGDGLADLFETGNSLYGGPTNAGSDPYNPDSDDNGIGDAEEAGAGLDPSTDSGLQAMDADLDGDGDSNLEELLAGSMANDSHSTLLTDGEEVSAADRRCLVALMLMLATLAYALLRKSGARRVF
jgi:hypothetical protein